MKPQSLYLINLKLLLITIIIISGLLTIALYRIKIDFDILNSLPDKNPVVADAKYIFTHHPMQDRIVIDLESSEKDLQGLVKKAEIIQAQLSASDLFKQVGLNNAENQIPGLITSIVDNLPFLFDKAELRSKVAPLLTAEHIDSHMMTLLNQLAGLEGIGQANLIAGDPLELRNFVLSRLSSLNPVQGAGFIHGFPVSPDNQHLLILATPKTSGTDTAASRKIEALINKLSASLNQDQTDQSVQYTLTAVGAYRAALDNETIVRRDTQRAILFATIGVVVLLLISFPRPYLGLLSLIPAVLGTIIAVFIYSLIHQTISILAIGFGGAIISITVDHSIAYLLFVDRKETVRVKEASEEVRAIGLIAVLTTVGAFLVLTVSGFSILSEIGQFAALGIACSFLFVHTVFPKLVPVVPPAKRKRDPWLLRLVNRHIKIRQPAVPIIVAIFGIAMAFNARPDFNVDISKMNTVSDNTLASEQRLQETWGNITSRVHLLLESDSLSGLQQKSDALSKALLQPDINQLNHIFTPSDLFPGSELASANFSAWKEFWTSNRISALKKTLTASAARLGFTADAFNPFFIQLENPVSEAPEIPEEFTELMGIRHNLETGHWILSTTLVPDNKFDSAAFRKDLTSHLDIRLFDPGLFASELGQLLSETFLKMMLMIGISVIVLIFLFFLDGLLTLVSLIPIIFSLICTLGTLNLLHHPLDIPGLMLSIIVFGMGIDYSLFMIRAYQRYGAESHPFHGLIRMAVLLAAVSTLIGFGVLVSADHDLLHSAGLVSLCGIGYAMIGSFTLLPPILRKIYPESLRKLPKGKTRFNRTINRYARGEAFPRMFARFKLKLDPMFEEIDRFVDAPGRVIDIGCGYGVPASWILDKYPNAYFFGLEPDRERSKAANRMLAENGNVQAGYSPDLPETDGPVDTVMMLDMLHYLSNEDLLTAFQNIHKALESNGKLIIRVTLPIKERTPWYRWIESTQIRLRGGNFYYRPLNEIVAALEKCHFVEIVHAPSGKDREETWIVSRSG